MDNKKMIDDNRVDNNEIEDYTEEGDETSLPDAEAKVTTEKEIDDDLVDSNENDDTSSENVETKIAIDEMLDDDRLDSNESENDTEEGDETSLPDVETKVTTEKKIADDLVDSNESETDSNEGDDTSSENVETQITIETMIAANRADCNGCEACANICPKKAITMVRDAEGFSYPKINHNLCIGCGRCDKVCPSLNFEPKVIDAFPPTFAAIYPNEKVLRQSSSGGIFSALSEMVLNNGGVVFGAGFDKNYRVRHASVKALDKLKNLRGSKYVQSKIGEVYKQVKKALATSLVLFTGTPCQCVGLKSFLGRDYDNLLTVEIICKGVPSPALWESYIDKLGYAHEIKQVNFRTKRSGWGQRIDINFADQEHKSSLTSANLYGRLFVRNLSLRPSCSTCKFKFPNGQSDLTIGDAWGVKDFAPEMFDSRGVSVIFVHTQKGAKVLEQVNLKIQQINFVDAVKKNTRYVSPTIADSRRETFFAELAESNDWYEVMQKYYNKDSLAIQNETFRKNEETFRETFTAITERIRQRFEKNILVVFTPEYDGEQKNLSMFFERTFKNCGIYTLQPGKRVPFACTEGFSLITSPLKDVAELSDFVKQRNITEIFVKLPLDFGDNSSLMTDWLNSCGLPARTFVQKS
jgi:coenzyme F420-reducing hydrogenase beta subunit